ncbi:MAG: 4-hydroxythreonine-4-phosphate dehydrogenase PdxA [Victivallaceae bacterium]|nr:4-hydroxythreonine-4-phosphate dehydrogenase PdxA [Victivallaceae bacterium]
MTDKTRPKIGLVMGDAAGIGPEIIIKALGKKEITAQCYPFVIGSLEIMKATSGSLNRKVTFTSLNSFEELNSVSEAIPVFDCEISKNPQFRYGVVDPVNGQNAIAYIEKGVELALSEKIDGITIAPLCKEAMHKGGLQFPDETSFLADLAGIKVKTLSKWGEVFVSTVVGHVPFRQISGLVTKERIIPVIKNLSDFVSRFKDSPRIGVAALNPHGGEDGYFGDEEIMEIKPAVEAAKKLGIRVAGPFPADTIFMRARKGEFDGVVFLYHDQGNISVKASSFGQGVLIYSGLPFPCTGPTHGIAYDIAGKDMADPGSFEEALKVNIKLGMKSRILK